MSSFISRVTIQNYKSIAACRVDLRQLMFLVGPNGSGKSNFLDALRFVADALRTSLGHALRDHGTIKEVAGAPGVTRTTLLCDSILCSPPVRVDIMLSRSAQNLPEPMKSKTNSVIFTAAMFYRRRIIFTFNPEEF